MEDYLKYLNESPTVFFKCRSEFGWPVEFVTKNVFDIFGFKPKEFLDGTASFIDLVFDEDTKQLSDEIDKLIEYTGIRYEFKPYRMITKNKKILWVQDITNIERDQEGKITHFHCYITDITKQIITNKKLDISEDIISTIYNNSFQFIGLMEPDGTLIKANKTSLEFVNVEEIDVIGKKFWDCPWWEHSVEEQIILQADIEKAAKGEFIRTKKVHYAPDGSKVYVDFSIKPVFNNKNDVVYLIPEGHNITENVHKEKQLERYINIINNNVLISTTDLEGKIISCSDKFLQVCGYPKSELIGKRHNIMKHPDNDISMYKNLWEVITKGHVWIGEHKNIKKNGDVFWVENVITPNFNDEGEIDTYTSVYTDITLRKEISELLITDDLTSIYNRRHFNTVFELELKRSIRHKENFILIMLDIDYFKQYNDIYGHHEGDLALIKVANTLKNTLKRAEDYIFRLGGEEFSIITTDIDKDGVSILCEKLRSNIEKLNIEHKGNKELGKLTISIGAVILTSHKHLDYEYIYKEADDSLYLAKDKGRNSIVIEEE